MAVSFLTSLNEEEFKNFLKEALSEIIEEGLTQSKSNIPEILDVKQAADFLRLNSMRKHQRKPSRILKRAINCTSKGMNYKRGCRKVK